MPRRVPKRPSGGPVNTERAQAARARRPYVYLPPDPRFSELEARVRDTDQAREAFALRLDAAMRATRTSNADLATALPCHPSLVAAYRRGQYLPSPWRLSRLASALSVAEGDLLPPGLVDRVRCADRGVQLSDLPGGLVRMRVAATVEAATARAIADLIRADRARRRKPRRPRQRLRTGNASGDNDPNVES